MFAGNFRGLPVRLAAMGTALALVMGWGVTASVAVAAPVPMEPESPASARALLGDPSPAAGVVGVASALSLVVVSDGTAPFDSDSSPGNDSSDHNGIVRSRDSVLFRWDYSIGTTGDVNFVQKLPAGMVWDASSAASCLEGAASVSSDKRTLTCTLGSVPAGAGSYLVKANVGSAGNGAVLTTNVASGALTSNDVSVTESSVPAVELSTQIYSTVSLQTGPDGVTQGVSIPFGVQLFTRLDAAKGLKGRGALADPFVFSIDVSGYSAAAAPLNCSAGQSTNAPYARIGLNGSATAANSVQNSGTWACTQPGGPGTPITVTVTGAVTDALSYPTMTSGGTAIDPSIAFLAVGAMRLWAPASDFQSAKQVTIRVSGFDPAGLTGDSNFGSGYAPGQAPGTAWVNGLNQSQTTLNFNPAANLGTNGRIFAPTGGTANGQPGVAGGASAFSGDAPFYPGQTARFGINVSNATLTSDPATNINACVVWDPNQVLVQPGAAVTWSGTLAGITPTIQYTNHVMSSEAERKAYDCGTVGDSDAQWFDSPAAAGGAGQVSGFRVLIPSANYGNTDFYILASRSGQPIVAGTPIPVYTQIRAAGLALVRSTYVAATNTGNRGTRVVAAEAQVRVAEAWDTPTSKPGQTRTITVTPTVTNPYGSAQGATARSVKVTTQLPSPCVQFVAGSASRPVTTLTPANLGPDGVACTADDGAGAILTWDLGDVESGGAIVPITFNVNILSSVAMPTTLTATSTIVSPSDASSTTSRTAKADLSINAPAEFAITKTASTALAQPGDTVAYSLGWSNRLPSSAGVAKVVDVLPYNGDVNGTHDLAGLTLVSASGSTGVSVEYTTASTASLATALAGDPAGDTGILWTPTKPGSGVTAVRFTTPELASGSSGNGTIVVLPTSLVAATSFTNSVTSAKASALASPVVDASPVTVASGSSSIAGNVYQDNDYSWSKNSGDSDLAGASVTLTGYSFGPDGVDNGGPGVPGSDDATITALTATTNASGDYAFQGLHSGKYSAAVTRGLPANLAAAAAPVQPISLMAQTAKTGNDFGFIVKIAAPVVVPDAAKTSTGTAKTVAVLANDTVDPSAVVTIGASNNPAHGTVVVNGDKTVTYTPAAGYAGSDVFTYTVTDKARQTASTTVTMTVVALPIAVADSYTVKETGGTPLAVLANDTGDAIGLDAVTSAPAHGTAVITGTTVTYTPTAGYAGSDTFSYRIKDSLGVTATATVSITVQPAPIAADDTARTGVGAATSVQVKANDTIAVPASTSLMIGTAPTHGLAVVQGDGTVLYTPVAGYSGPDSFTYTLRDGLGQSSTATVSVSVIAMPTAAADSATLAIDTAADIDALANDLGDALSITGISPAGHGTATITGSGTSTALHYVPAPGYFGTDAFTYTVTDSVGQQSTATVSITVLANPAAIPDQAKTKPNVAVTIAVLANDTGVGLSVVSATGASHGTQSVNADGTITYTPNPGYVGMDEFTYTIKDSLNVTSSATVTVTVQAAPIAVVDSAVTGQGQGAVISVLANDTLPDAAATEVTFSTPAHGSVVANPDRTLSYTPGAGFTGIDTFTYTLTDDLGQTSTATVTVTVRARPSAEDDSAKTAVDQPVSISILANDTVPNPAVTTVTLGAPAHGTVSLGAGNVVTYTPSSAYFGTDAFTYTLTDDAGQSSVATVSLAVQAAPVAVADSVKTGQGHTATIAVESNDTVYFPAGTALVVTVAPAHGSATVVGTSVVYQPAAGYVGLDTFTYTLTDDLGQSSAAQVSVTVQAAPVAVNDTIMTGIDSPVTVPVLANDTVPFPSGTTTSVDQPAHGSVAVNADGSVTYSPAPGYAGADSFTYTLTDDLGQSSTATVSVTVVDGPVANNDTGQGGVDKPIVVPVLANDQGDGISVTSVGTAMFGSVTNDGNGSITYMPGNGFSGTDEFSYTVTDSLGRTATATVTVTVFAAIALDDVSFTTGQNMSYTFDPIKGDVATGTAQAFALAVPTFAPIHMTGVGAPSHGVAILNADGTVTYTPSPGYAGADEFSFSVEDVVGQTATATVHVTVQAAPVAADSTVSVTTPLNTPVTVDVLAGVTGTALTLGKIGAAGHGSVAIVDGKVVYTPDTGFVGGDSFVVQVIDDLGQSVSVTVLVTVTPGQPDTGGNSGGTTSSPQAGPGWLPNTGTTSAGLLVFAALLLGAGLFLVLMRRRRARDTDR